MGGTLRDRRGVAAEPACASLVEQKRTAIRFTVRLQLPEATAMTAATALSGTFNADPVHSNFGFAVRYQGVSLFKGTLGDVAATLVDGTLEGVAKVDSISIRTPEQFRQHVLSADFFDVENHPEVSFISTSLEVNDDGTVAATGDLTIRG